MPSIGQLPKGAALQLLSEVDAHVIVYRVDGQDVRDIQVVWASRERSPSGADVHELLERPLVEVLPGLLATPAPYAYLAAAQTGERMELPPLEYEGRAFAVTVVPLDATHVAGIIRDVTQDLASEAELKRRVSEATHELSVANRELKAFASSVSHDLRAPLRALTGFSQYLAETQHGLDDEGRYLMTRIQAGAARMGALIDALLRLSRITRHEMARRDVDLAQQAREVLAALREQEPDRQVRVDIPDRVVVQADPELSRVVLVNLLGNAWKFTRDTPRARIVMTDEDGWVQVKDNGVGFDPDYADQLYRPFARLHATDTFEGLGIGLAIVHRIVTKHGGELKASGAPGRGARFRFRLRGQDGAHPAG